MTDDKTRPMSPETGADLGGWQSATQGGTPPASSGESTRTGSLDHLNGGGPLTSMVPRPTDRTPTPRRCDCAEHLRRLAPWQANGSRDFGRGYAHAAALLAARPGRVA